MKKLFSLFFAICFSFILGITAAAAEAPLRLFSVSPDDGFSCEDVALYASEKGFNGIFLDLRGEDSADFYRELTALNENLDIFIFADEKTCSALPDGTKIIVGSEISEEDISLLSENYQVSFYLPFDNSKALEKAEYFYEKGFFDTVFVENLLSCYSEYGYEQYLSYISEKFTDADIITVNDLKRVLVPVVKGDFFGDTFELNSQYLVNVLNGYGFCVSDFSALMENRNGSAGFLTAYFESETLDTYADFSVSQKLEITRPTGKTLSVETAQYTIFGTSDPEKKLFMNGEELERISESGLFAVTVDVTKKGKTYSFTQGNKTVSVTIKKATASSGSGKTSVLTSCSPSASVIMNEENSEITLSCVGPSGGKITATVFGKTVTLKRVAYADKGVPAKFTAKIDLSGEYNENEVTDLGKVSYALSYNGKTTYYESSANIYYVGKNSRLSVRANAELAGVEHEPGDSGNYVTTLRTGCSDYVTGIAENGWYELSLGGYIKPSQCNIITGSGDITCRIDSVEFEKGKNYEKLTFSCSNIPAFTGELFEKALSLTIYNTELSDLTSINRESELMRHLIAVNNGDGSIKLNFCSTKNLWGWDIFTDPENKTFSVVLKAEPKLSTDLKAPLSGITITVCAGHGGPDPGALSVAGENGVNEAEINLVNAMLIKESLENLGANVVLLITEDKKLDTYGRTDPARYAYSDLYICCHANSVAESSKANLWCGTYVYYHYDESAEFSKKLCDYISAATKRDNEGSWQDYYSVTRLTICPAVMLEVGFVSNPKEFESLIDKQDIQKTALAVTKAVLEILDN